MLVEQSYHGIVGRPIPQYSIVQYSIVGFAAVLFPMVPMQDAFQQKNMAFSEMGGWVECHFDVFL